MVPLKLGCRSGKTEFALTNLHSKSEFCNIVDHSCVEAIKSLKSHEGGLLQKLYIQVEMVDLIHDFNSSGKY